jgi:type I restriction enzyme S subunit
MLIKDIEKNYYSLNYSEYIKSNNKNHDVDIKEYVFSEIFEFLQKSKRKAGDSNDYGKYNFYTSSFVKKKSDFCDYNEKCLILGTGGNASIHIDDNFSCSADNFVCKIKVENIDIKYIYYYILNNIFILND